MTAPDETRKSRVSTWVLTAVVIAATLAVSTLSAVISFNSIRELALLFAWPAGLSWMLMPILELLMIGSMAEHAHRRIEGERGYGPLVMAYLCLLVTLACNVTLHILKLIAAQPGAQSWSVVVLGIFGAFAPLGQIGGTHLLVTRLSRVAQQVRLVRRDQSQSAAGTVVNALAKRVVNALEQPSPGARPDAPSDAPRSAPRRDAAKRTQRARGAPVPIDRDAVYAAYAAQLDASGTEMEVSVETFAAMNITSGGGRRNARIRWRHRYADEVVSGARRPRDGVVLPGAIQGMIAVHGARDLTDELRVGQDGDAHQGGA